MDDLHDVVPMRLRDVDERLNRITGAVVDSALAVQREYGVGLLEKPYELALAHELRRRGHAVQNQVEMPITYGGLVIPRAYYLDLLVDDEVVVEVKAVEQLLPIHAAQLGTHLKFSHRRVGLLINFHASPLKTGIQRVLRVLESARSAAPAPSALNRAGAVISRARACRGRARAPRAARSRTPRRRGARRPCRGR